MEDKNNCNPLLNEIANFNRKLKPTTTVVRENTYINVEGKKSDYGHVKESRLVEYFDKPSEVLEKVKRLAELITNSKKRVFYTGAGISTSAKIPDYRGTNGSWTLSDKGYGKIDTGKKLDRALPTIAHMGFVSLMKANLLNHVVSTNLDGLHLRSGIHEDNLSELHGNCYKETCDTCGKKYHRNFDCTGDSGTREDHWTSRFCEEEGCKGKLLDSIIHFGENLPVSQYNIAYDNSNDNDLSVVWGSSMTVKPACDLPIMTLKNKIGKLVIINLQKTKYDSDAEIWYLL
eukprot:TRINITY_DN2022_c0_g1_i2.p1 TRINITY_DN2022_c0_g1~~TRINITY_DN2022_c0_g1_i2.p1  ORF type:complete len:288 (-),score=68.65 TRINITY_DN2022_c0_g1_i2:1058-1921(-)